MTKKDTHTIPQIEKLILDKLEILKNGETIKEKKQARKELIMLEKLIKDVDYKKFNGRKYPEQLCWHSDRPDLNDKEKKEVYKLIDSVDSPTEGYYFECKNLDQIDLSGVFVSDDRTTEFARTSILDLYKPIHK